MLATRTRDLLRFRQGGPPAGTEFADKRVAVQIDGGRVSRADDREEVARGEQKQAAQVPHRVA